MDLIENITYDELYGIIRDVERFNVFINIIVNAAKMSYDGKKLYFDSEILDAFIRELAGDEYDAKLDQLKKEAANEEK